MSTKICKLCGKEFEAKGNQAYCNNKHYKNCAICGRSFEIKRRTMNKETCSPECQTELGRQTMIAEYAMKKQGE